METTTFPCRACGAQLAYQPGAEHLICDRCGTEQPIPGSDGTVDELDLQAALAGAMKVDPRSLAENAREVRCGGCGAVAVQTGTADRCAFCDSPVVVVEDDEAMLRPESVLPFGIAKKQAAVRFQEWLASRWFAPNDLQERARQDGMDGVYLPYFTFDSDALATYQGERGKHYYETVHTTDSEGKRVTKQVRRTAWTPTSGVVQHSFDDVLICASRSLPQAMIQGLEPWDLSALRPFEPSYLAGFQAERYGIELPESWVLAQKRMDDPLRQDVRWDIGGDEQRIHRMDVQHRSVTFKHTLLPLWISSYRYQGEVYRVIVNARTGAVNGDRPYSWIKIGFAVAVGLILFALILGGYAAVSGGR